MKPHAKATSLQPTHGRRDRMGRFFGAFATSGSCGEDGGSGARVSKRRARRVLGLAVLVVLAVLAVLPLMSALAFVEAPQIRGELKGPEVFATRAHIEAYAILNRTAVPMEWQGEYAPAESNGEAPPPPKKTGEAPWTLAGGEKTVAGNLEMALGTQDATSNGGNERAVLHHLLPGTVYYARFHVEDEGGEAEKLFKFDTTAIARPEVARGTGISSHATTLKLIALTPTSVAFAAQVETNGAQSGYSFEYAESKAGPWKAFTSGATGTITVAQDFADPEATLTGLKPETTYFVRLKASNKEGEIEQLEFLGAGRGGEETDSFTTPTSKPAVVEPKISGVTATSAHLAGDFHTNGLESEWRFEYLTSVAGAKWSVVPGAEGTVSAAQAKAQVEAEAKHEDATLAGIEGTLSGLSPATTYSVRLFAKNEAGEGVVCYENHDLTVCEPISTATHGIASFRTFGPPLAATFATHDLHGAVLRLLGSVSPEGYEAHYRFEYVSQRQFEAPGGEGGFAKAASTPEGSAGGTGIAGSQTVGQDLPPLQAGETYRYRIVATNASPGNPVVDGEEQSLTVAAAAPAGSEETCPNQALRTGASANLPDCRAYEQVTPVDKEGAQEIFKYAGLKVPAFALVGEDGNHLMLEASAVHWGSGPAAGASPYFFSRDPEKGWRLTAATVQPEAGPDEYAPQVLAPALGQFGFQAGWHTGSGSPSVEFRAGPPGGPYVTVATVPRKQAEGGGWVAASHDFSKLILQVEDHGLIEPRTTTKSGSDLYEYAAGALRQVNVGLGTCGATIVAGNEGDNTKGQGQGSSPHALAADGSRVFFEAVPGSECSQAKHLYVRVNGGGESPETVDLGAYRFAAANADGSEALLEKRVGENPGLYLYRQGAQPRFLPSTGLAGTAGFTVSEDLKAIYFKASGAISRYDVSTETLAFLVNAEERAELQPQVSRDGRYYYFTSREVAGVPAGAVVPGGGQEVDHQLIGFAPTVQVFRYDSVEHAIECISCASAFDPEPRLGSGLGGEGAASPAPAGTPRLVFASANGEFAFFQTPAALVPADIDGEVTPEGTAGLGLEHPSGENSVSGDVYEWRQNGVAGCAQVQGCLALITNGRGGYLNELIGTAEEGRDVFIYTSSQLVGPDNDTAGDIYDVRTGGGFAEPARPVECNGGACFTPLASPSDLTPSSATFQGPGNPLAQPLSLVNNQPKPKPKPKPKPRCRTRGKHRCKAGKPVKRTRKHAKRAARSTHTRRRTGA